MNYIPIGFKSDYSLLKSLFKVKDIIEFAKIKNCKYVGILDENPYGIMDFYDKCISNDLKCIFGMILKIGDYKLYFYIQNYRGYKNLIKLYDLVQDEKLSFNEIYKYNDGLICVLPYESYNLLGRLRTAFQVFLAYKNAAELKNAEQISKNVLFLNEIMYLKKEDAKFLDVLYQIGGENYPDDDNNVLSASDFDKNTVLEFQKIINFNFDFNNRYIPHFCSSKEKSFELLNNLTMRGLNKRMNGNVPDEYKKRLEFEINVIKNMGFVDYFLIVYDYVKYSKKNNICVGPGRGSAAGSLVSYTLGITDIDPLKYDLLFERFLNPQRITMPDIDIDFEDIRRNDVINYVKEKYGERYVSLIVAYGTLSSRQVVRDVSKVMKIDQFLIDEFSKKLDSKKSLRENLNDKELVSYIKMKGLEDIYKISIKLEGLKKNVTTHAAGVIISEIPLLEIIPMIKSKEGNLTGYAAEYLEKLGLLKMDFLGVRNLTTLHNMVDIVKKKDPNFDLKQISFTDPKTYELLSSGNTDGIFQFETIGMTNFLKKLQPENFDDLVAAIALFRPGPMENIDEFIARRKHNKKVEYIHKDLEPILKSTYGIIVYQEQIMQILSYMGGYSYAEADILRRAMSKKKKSLMIEEREKFVIKAKEKGYTENIAQEVYDLIVKFANYGFNKSHSVAYALIGYQMAYLKANHVNSFHLNTLNMNMTSGEKVRDVIEEARRKGLKIIKPNINVSTNEYLIENNSIIMPLTSINDISSSHSKIISGNAPYSDFFDFCIKNYGNGINRVQIETLIKSDTMNDFGYSRNTLLKNLDSAITYVELARSLDKSLIMKPVIEVSSEEDGEISELDIFGFYISGHPASKYSGDDFIKLSDITKYVSRRITMILLLEKIKIISTKKGEKMAFLEVSDDTGKMGAVIFPKNNSIIDNISIGNLYKFKSQILKKTGEIQIIVEDISVIDL